MLVAYPVGGFEFARSDTPRIKRQLNVLLYVHPFLHPHCGLRKKQCKGNHFLNTDSPNAKKS